MLNLHVAMADQNLFSDFVRIADKQIHIKKLRLILYFVKMNDIKKESKYKTEQEPLKNTNVCCFYRNFATKDGLNMPIIKYIVRFSLFSNLKTGC